MEKSITWVLDWYLSYFYQSFLCKKPLQKHLPIGVILLIDSIWPAGNPKRARRSTKFILQSKKRSSEDLSRSPYFILLWLWHYLEEQKEGHSRPWRLWLSSPKNSKSAQVESSGNTWFQLGNSATSVSAGKMAGARTALAMTKYSSPWKPISTT